MLGRFLNDKKLTFAANSLNSFHSNTARFARLTCFNFLSKIYNLISNFDKNKKYVFVGDGAINYKNILKDNLGDNAIILPMYNAFPRATILCELALNKKEANIYTLEPEYISKSRAEKKF